MRVQVVPLYKLRSVARRVHDKVLRATLPTLLSDPKLALIQWLPDVMQVGYVAHTQTCTHTRVHVTCMSRACHVHDVRDTWRSMHTCHT